jgi:malate/lactate dehydrogenase
MELEDAAYPLLENVYVTSKSEEAFENADAVILLGGFPRRPVRTS